MGVPPKSAEQFLSEIDKVNGGRYLTHCTVYVNKRTKVQVQCAKCGHLWYTRPDNLLNGSACPKCVTGTTEEFIAKLNEKFPGLYLTDKTSYVNYRTPVTIQCALCGHEWKNTPAKLLFYGNRCKYCFGSGLKTTEMFTRELSQKYPGKFDLSRVDYKNTDTKVSVQCTACLAWLSITPAKLLIGRGCKRCLSSRGEKKVEEWLRAKGLHFLQEHRFPECRDKKPLPFDFYLPELNVAIEYDGIQHFCNDGQGRNGQRWGSHDLQGVKRRDAIKTAFCEQRGVRLIRISYKSLNHIEKVLEAELSHV